MWMDLVAALVFIMSTSAGFRNGLLHTLLHTFGWIISFALGIVLYARVDGMLRAYTDYYSIIHNKISDRIISEGSYATGSFTTNMPAVLHDFIEPIKNSVAAAIATNIADFLFKIICFLLVMIVLRLIFYFIMLLFSKKKNKGILGFADGVFGLLAGVVRGLILIFLLLAFLVPVLSLYPDGHLIAALESSRIAGILYDNNYLLLVLSNTF